MPMIAYFLKAEEKRLIIKDAPRQFSTSRSAKLQLCQNWQQEDGDLIFDERLNINTGSERKQAFKV